MVSRKVLFGTLYGLAAGLAFALTAWGLDAWLLSGAHWAHAWTRLLPGLLVALLLGGLTGALGMTLESTLPRLTLWLGLGVLLGWMAVWLPWRVAPWLALRLAPALGPHVVPLEADAHARLTLFCIAITVPAALLCGALQPALVEQASFSPADGAILLPMALAMFLLALPGLAADNAVNARLRDAAVTLHRALEFALENRATDPDPAQARRFSLGAVRPIADRLTPDYRLFHASSDALFEQNRILVQADGRWSACLLVAGHLLHCQPVSP